MDPIHLILWAASLVFVATCGITVAHLAGYAPRVKLEHGKWLIRILVGQVVAAGVGAFVYYLNHDHAENQLPVERFVLIEQAPTISVMDGFHRIYVRSSDVARSRRVAALQFTPTGEFTSAVNVTLKPGESQSISVAGRKYQIGFSEMGQLDPNPEEKHGKPKDFIFLSMRRQD